MDTKSHERVSAWKILLAFAIIYFVWGSTYLAIRIGVQEVPPFLFAAMRFLAAGLALCGWTLACGESAPSCKEWMSIFVIALLIFVFDYGLLFWAEQRVPSGLAAVMLATIPMFTAILEIVFLRSQKATARLILALLIGLGGVAVLVSRTLLPGGTAIDRMGAIALLVAAFSWSVATTLMRRLPLPQSKPMSSGSQMLAGGALLAVSSGALGEFRKFHLSAVSLHTWLALAYLVVFGSVIAFTAYVWLIHHESPTKVGTYAYVNPVVAVLIGYSLGGEPLGVRTVLGTLLILTSVAVITMKR